jgi:hypothetical protein
MTQISDIKLIRTNTFFLSEPRYEYYIYLDETYRGARLHLWVLLHTKINHFIKRS